MKKVLLVGLKNGANLGDVIIDNCTKYLIELIFKDLNYIDYEIKSIDMTEDDFSMVPTSDLIVFVGGGIIKFKYQNFYNYIDKVTNIADKYGIPIIFNAVGVEGYDKNDENCIKLYNAINRSCVKQITTRDDLELLQNAYIINNDIHLEKVADSAVWTNEVFNTKRLKNSDVIGLGVVREGIFKSNGINIGLEEQLKLWSDIINELELRNEKWKIFTTGWPSDMKFAINLMKYIGREDDINSLVVKQPLKAIEVVENISNYKAIIAGRLHANIVAYSLNIPAIGFIWNDKCAFWGENIGFPERYFSHENFNGVKMVEECLNAIKIGYCEEDKMNYKMSSYNSLYRYLKEFVK